MKRILPLTALVLVTVFTQCKKEEASTPQPSTTIDSLKLTSASVDLYWHTSSESGIVAYYVQQSADSVNFTNVIAVGPLANNGSDRSYMSSISLPSGGRYHYRIKDSLTNGQVIYSNVFSTTIACSLNSASILGRYYIYEELYKADFSTPAVNIFSDYPICERDNDIVLNSNGTYNYVDAGISCTPAGNFDGNWSLSGTTLNIDGDPSTVTNFTCTELWLYSVIDPSVGESYTLKMRRR